MLTKKRYLLPLFLVSFWIAENLANSKRLKQPDEAQEKFLRSFSSQLRYPIFSNLSEDDTIRTSRSNFKGKEHEEDAFLRIRSHIRDVNATSGDDVQFKCKVDGNPNYDIHYTWYHNNVKISPNNKRFLISQRSWGSKLFIKNLYTINSGLYRCEASNGLRRVYSSAVLQVSFKRPPTPRDGEKVKIRLPQGRCEAYRGTVCRNYFGKYGIYMEEFEDQTKMENAIKLAVDSLKGDVEELSTNCRYYTVPAFCYYIFRPCKKHKNGAAKRAERLCREDCESLKRDICHNEYLKMDSNIFSKNQTISADCSFLPSTKNSVCKKLNFSQNKPSNKQSKATEKCYMGKGEKYSGTVNTTESGKLCTDWSNYMVKGNRELLDGHNYCRNPNGFMHKPWCFVSDDGNTLKMPCNIEKCNSENKNSTKILITIASCVGALLCSVFLIALFSCLRSSRCSKNATKISKTSTNDSNLQRSLCSVKNVISHLPASSVRILSQIGRGNFGNIYKGAIVVDGTLTHKESFAIVSMEENFMTTKLEEFRREMEVLAKLQHPHVASLKAAVDQPSFHYMVFEFTDQVDLHEYLVLNSPCRNSTKRGRCDFNNHALSSIDNVDFMGMALQIASGMEYLTNHGFIHKDLAARNILVCGNMEMKICNLGVIRDSYITCYFTTLQGKYMPIRWMAPESLHSWTFSDKSTVWSFGVLLWEMFSYGLQPYCGYSNHEVLDMISARQLLACPDQCPAKIYSLMQECWATLPKQRPTFQQVQERLRSGMETGEVMIVQSAYLNRGQANSAPSPPPEYQSHCSSQLNFPRSSYGGMWNGNEVENPTDTTSFISTASASRRSGSLARSNHQYQMFLTTANANTSLTSYQDSFLTNN